MGRRRTGGGERGVSDALLVSFCVVVTLTGVLLVWNRLRESSGLGRRETPALDARAPPPTEEAEAATDADDRPLTTSSGNRVVLADAGPEAGRSTPRDVVPEASAGGEEGEGAPAAAPPRITPSPPPLRATSPESDVPATDQRSAAEETAPAPARVVGTPSRSATRRLVDRLCADLEALHALHGRYPTSGRDFGANRGVEALYVALGGIGRTDGLRVGDVDDDGRAEILDAWGRPLLYFSADDYRSRQFWAPGDGVALPLSPARVGAGAVFRAAGTFQVRSAGLDGRPDTGHGDDVTSWTLR